MQTTARRGRRPLAVIGALAVVMGACSSPTTSPPTSASRTTSQTLSSSITTALTSTTMTSTVPPATGSPTVIVPQRVDGLESLDLSPEDLDGVTVLTPNVLELLPHDRTVVTEGLTLTSDLQLLESTGFYGRSSRRLIDRQTGDLVAIERVRPELYATGIATLVDGRGVQFTQLEELVQVFDTEDLTLVEERSFGLEVNGACTLGSDDEQRIVVSSSDGSLSIVSSATLDVVGSLTPRIGDSRLPPLTDLSCEPDIVWAVVGSSGVLVGLDPATGEVTSLADLSRLTPAGLSANDVLSGIAHRASTETWFITGRRWDVLYEVSLR